MSTTDLSLRAPSADRAVRALRRWGAAIAVATAMSAIVAFAVSSQLPREYVATAELFIAPASSPTVSFQDVVLGTNVARSYVQLLTSEVVLRPAMDVTGWPGDLRQFRDRMHAAQIRDTSIITVGFEFEDPVRAATIANAIAQSFINQTSELQSNIQGTTTTQLETQIKSLEDDIASIDQQIASLRVEAAATPGPGQTASSRAEAQALISQLDNSRQTKQQTLAQLIKTREDMRLASVRAESSVSLWQPATPPEQPVSPRVLLNTAIAALAGLAMALAAVFAVGFIDDRLTDPAELEARLGVVPLGQIHLGERPDSLQGKLFVRDSPRSSVTEAFRSLRTNVQFADVDHRPRTLVVTSAMPREGKSVVSANLALAFAQAGSHTILIDADLRRPSQHRLFGLSAAAGLTSLLTDTLPLSELGRFEVSSHLAVIPSGPLPPNPAELLSSAKMSTLLNQLANSHADATVIVDTSPVLAAADAVALATKVDGVIVVIDSAHTRAALTRQAIEAIRRVRGRVLGALMNKVSEDATGYYYYYGYYGARPAPPSPARRQVPTSTGRQ